MNNFIELLKRTSNMFNASYLAIVVAGVVALIFILFLFVGNKNLFFYLGLILFLSELLIFSFIDSVQIYIKNVILIFTALEISVFALILKIPFTRKLKKSNIEEFIKNLDKEMEANNAKNDDEILQAIPRNNNFSDKIKESVSTYKEKAELTNINLEHAKSLVDRLNYYQLTIEDKRKVYGIEDYLITAETTKNVDKEGLNDKLAELIKILAKYNA